MLNRLQIVKLFRFTFKGMGLKEAMNLVAKKFPVFPDDGIHFDYVLQAMMEYRNSQEGFIGTFDKLIIDKLIQGK